jgi:hypothetical protein
VKKDYEVKESSTYNFSDEELINISSFYCNNFRIGNGNNTIMVTVSDLKKFLSIGAVVLTIFKGGNLIGSIISTIIPLKIYQFNNEDNKILNYKKDNTTFGFGCTSSLILEASLRGKGLGMALIQESLQLLYHNVGLGAYFINTVSRCDNSIPLSSWTFPLNFDKLDKCKFDYRSDYKIYFAKMLEDEKIMIKKVDECNNNVVLAHDFYFNQVKDKKLYFAPSLEYWEKWILCFSTYLVYDKEQTLTGIFSFNSRIIKYPTNRVELNTGSLILCIGSQPMVLKAALFTAKSLFDLAFLFEIGDINKEILNSIFAQKTHTSYINFFNMRIKLNKEDFFAPPF